MKKKKQNIKKVVKDNIFIIIILIFALAIRAFGFYPGHPNDHPDELMSYASAIEMILNNDLDPRRYDYPSGVPLIHYLFFKSFVLPPIFYKIFLFDPKSFLLYFLPNSDFMKDNRVLIFGKSDVLFLFWSRFLTAILGTASVYLVYEIGKRLFNKYTGLAAAFFLAFNYRHVLSSHLALSDVPNSFFVLLATFFSLLLFEKDSKIRYLLCGLSIGLSFSMKYQIFPLFPFIFVHLIWVLKRKDILRLIHPYFILSLLLVPAVFIILNPYFFLHLKEALSIVEYVSLRYGRGASRFNLYAVLFLYKWGIGVLPFLTICIGFIFACIKTPVKALFLLSYIGIFLYVFLYYMSGGTYVRNFTTVIPLLMIFAGFGFVFLVSLFQKILNKNMIIILSVLSLVIINADSIKNSFVLSINYIKPWNREVLAKWASDYVPNNSIIINDNLGMPSYLQFSDKTLQTIPRGHEEGEAITEYIEKKYDFAVLNATWNQYNFYWSGLSYQKLIQYQDMPYSILRNSYAYFLLSEYKNYLVYEKYKPWQSPDNNYLVMKIPQKPKTLGKKIASFHFDNGLEGWKLYNFDNKKGQNLVYDKEIGYEENGSIELPSKIYTNNLSRAISPFISVLSGKLYTVEGFIKANNDIKSRFRDGFLRVDFYAKDDVSSFKDDAKAVKAVSGRFFGPKEWIKKNIIVKAPQNVKYLTVSFQRDDVQFDNTYWLDDIDIYESNENLLEKFKEIPYIKSTVPDDIFFPKSIY